MILILIVVIAATAVAGWLVRDRDRIAAGLLLGFSGVLLLLLIAAFFGLIGG